ncbi:MAG: flagellar motor switch protein FliN [Planctomycetes bacterium]|nr:flagellar motor switch protein FliN [Planctomycetota bacterium]
MSQHETQRLPESTDLERAIDDATRAVAIQTTRLDELDEARPAGDPIGLDGLRDVPVSISIELGRARLPLAEVLALAPGSLVRLDRAAHEPVDLFVGGRLYARGEVVVVGDRYGIRVTSLGS